MFHDIYNNKSTKFQSTNNLAGIYTFSFGGGIDKEDTVHKTSKKVYSAALVRELIEELCCKRDIAEKLVNEAVFLKTISFHLAQVK